MRQRHQVPARHRVQPAKFADPPEPEAHALKPSQKVVLNLSPETLPLAMMPGVSFPDVLRHKLKWTGSNL